MRYRVRPSTIAHATVTDVGQATILQVDQYFNAVSFNVVSYNYKLDGTK